MLCLWPLADMYNAPITVCTAQKVKGWGAGERLAHTALMQVNEALIWMSGEGRQQVPQYCNLT